MIVGIAPDDYTLKFAVFHTLFNVIGVVLMTPLINTAGPTSRANGAGTGTRRLPAALPQRRGP